MGLRVCKPGEPTLMRTLESCIRLGHPLLVEEMGGTMEPQLLPLLEGTVSSQGHRRFIRLGGSDIDYDVNFKLYMTTKLANPHYLPEVCIATNLINFTVTQEVSHAIREHIARQSCNAGMACCMLPASHLLSQRRGVSDWKPYISLHKLLIQIAEHSRHHSIHR